MPLSRPKDKIKILLLEGISRTALDTLKAAGYTNIEHHAKALEGPALKAALEGASMVGIRSRSQLTPEVLDGNRSLIAIGCFSVGTNQVALDFARDMGLPVFNAPFSNTRSVAELTIAEIIMLYRRTFPKSMAAHSGIWQKTAEGAGEVRAKTLGIVGYGNIGSQLAVLAEAIGMRVIFFDLTDKLRHGNVEPTDTLDELLAKSDVVSLHVPQTPETRGMIGEKQIRGMKKGAYLINNARGTVVDIEALAAALKDGHLAGAAIDVFPVEPKSNSDRFNSPLQGLDNVILTPHVGGSTEEAQERIGSEVAKKFIEYSDVGSTVGAVNFPQVQLPIRPHGTRFIQVQRNLPGELQRLNEVFAKHRVNIAAQYYQTDGEIGYVVLDCDDLLSGARDILAEIRSMPGTIRARLLYRRL
ncbi:MAG: phosphoglycerate dehydrogenase [Hyphomicrobiaceae bacterium]|nr:phosphoglycerate dehydrogenase [Hyphomicrobiaceae bacterium]